MARLYYNSFVDMVSESAVEELKFVAYNCILTLRFRKSNVIESD